GGRKPEGKPGLGCGGGKTGFGPGPGPPPRGARGEPPSTDLTPPSPPPMYNVCGSMGSTANVEASIGIGTRAQVAPPSLERRRRRRLGPSYRTLGLPWTVLRDPHIWLSTCSQWFPRSVLLKRSRSGYFE